MSLLDQLWPHAVMLASAFGAATLLPLGSEAVLVAQIKAGLASPASLLVSATVGNVGGACLNWWLGRHLQRFEGRRWFPLQPGDIAEASARFRRLGVWSLLLAWMPVIGDPLTFVAGIIRVPLIIFLPLVTIGKALRYIVIVLAVPA